MLCLGLEPGATRGWQALTIPLSYQLLSLAMGRN